MEDEMADEIVIGTSLPKTGPYAETQFLQYQRSYDQWVADVNASGGILGKQVKFVWYDDNGTAEGCEANFKKLINEDKVDLLLGPCHSVLIEPMAHVTEEAQMVLLEGSGSVSEMFRKGRKWLFLVWDADCNYMKSYYEFVKTQGVTKVGSIAGNRPRGLGHARGAEAHAQRLGLDMAFNELYSGEADYADIFKRAKASGAEAIAWDIEARGPAKKEAIQAAVDAGFKTSQLWLSENPGQPVADGVFSRVTWVPNDPRPESQKFLADFRRLWNDEPEFHCAGGYSVGQVMHQAVEKVGGTDQKKLREAILSMEFDTIIGKLKYGEDGLPIATFPLAQWQNGKAELVFPDASMTSKARFD